jgi:hypothetical protein
MTAPRRGEPSFMATTTDNALDRFVSKARGLFAHEADPEQRFTRLGPMLAELLADPAVKAAAKTWPECHVRDNRPENLLFYEDPDYGFVINGLVVNAAGYSTKARIHDHGRVYTLYGLLDGNQRIERFERVDDGSKKEYCEIRKTFDSSCAPGEIDLVRPFEIHAEDTVGERAVAVIVRSESNSDFLQGRYVPDEHRYWEGLGPVQTRISFF